MTMRTKRASLKSRLAWTCALLLLAVALPVGVAFARSAQIVTLQVGDYGRIIGPQGSTHVICYVAPDVQPPKAVECYLANKTGVRPRSYSAISSERGVAVFYYDAKRKYREIYEVAHPTTTTTTPPRILGSVARASAGEPSRDRARSSAG